MNQVVKTIKLLKENGYKRVAVVVPTYGKMPYALGSLRAEIVSQLSYLEEDFTFNQQLLRLEFSSDGKDKQTFNFYLHAGDSDALKLRGAQFDAVIIDGEISKEFSNILDYGTRLGDNPIRIYVK